jgi:hypothetical protein
MRGFRFEDSVLSVAPITIAAGFVALVAYGASATEEHQAPPLRTAG